eukprot:10809028-Lingulodinium_polyedra.AAC.1
MLVDSLEADGSSKVSRGKTVLTTSSKKLYDAIALRLGKRNRFARVRHVKNLGVGFAARGAATAVMSGRLKVVKKRKSRFLALRSAGGSTKQLWRAGPAPALHYGCEVTGISESNLAVVRSLAAQCSFGTTKGRSITASFLFADARELDP